MKKKLVIAFLLSICIFLGFSKFTNAQFSQNTTKFNPNTSFSCKTDYFTNYRVNKYRMVNGMAKTFIVWNRSFGPLVEERCQLVAKVLQENNGEFLYLTDALDKDDRKVICAEKEYPYDGKFKHCDKNKIVIKADYNTENLLKQIKNSVIKGGSPAQNSPIYQEHNDITWINWKTFLRNINDEIDE